MLKLNWKRYLTIAFITIYVYTLMEWLFFLTMPASFMHGMNMLEKLSILFVSGGLLSLFLGTICAIILLAAYLLRNSALSAPILWGALAIPGAVISLLGLLLVDNFTYTLSKVGIVTSTGIWRGFYAVLLISALYLITRWLYRLCQTSEGQFLQARPVQLLVTAVLGISAIAFAVQRVDFPQEKKGYQADDTKNLPHILLIGSDALDASHLSVYGYERNTTPFLQQKSPEFIVAERAFPNYGYTSWSLVSILTGKSPAETEMLKYRILRGSDAYQHLPGILRQYGYYTVQFGVLEYADADKINLQGAFDEVNGQSSFLKKYAILGQNLGISEAVYFVSVLEDRAFDRLAHIFFIKKMENPYQIVQQPDIYKDQEKVEAALNLLKQSQQPVFIHIHLMGTHGPRFGPLSRTFSQGQEQTRDWMVDFYDDAIVDFDALIERIYTELSENGLLDDTLLIIYSDHNRGNTTVFPVPLLIRLPEAQGRIVQSNVQNADIAPTILEYLDIPQSPWMTGRSFLKVDPDPDRVIISGGMNDKITIGHSKIVWQDSVLQDASLYEFLSEVNVSRRSFVKTLLVYKYGSEYVPPPATGLFADVEQNAPFAPWVEEAYRAGIIDACTEVPLSFCPQKTITRQEAALFILKAVEGSNYMPAPAKGIFNDVPADSSLAPWVEEFFRRGITSGCSTRDRLYCPNSELSRGQFLLFLSKAFSKH